MRFAFAIASLIVSGVLLLLGLAQHTVFAGPDEIVRPVELTAEADYAVIPGEAFAAVPGQANVVVSGADGFAAIGSSADVAAWIAPFPHAELTPTAGEASLSSAPVAAVPGELSAKQLAAVEPRGSDLWLEQQEGAGRLPVVAATGQSVIVSAGAGAEVSLAWVQDERRPWTGPLLVAGTAFALLGLLLYLLAVDHNRRGLGPRRGRSGPLLGIRDLVVRPRGGKRRGTARFIAVPALGLTALLALSGCSADSWPDLGPAPTADDATQPTHTASTVAPVPITQAQIDRVIADIATVAGEGDDTLDPKVLTSRFVGDALTQRTAHYKIRSDVPDYEVVLPRITAEQLDYELVQSTEDWPRTVFATVASTAPKADPAADQQDAKSSKTQDPGDGTDTAASPSLALVMTQESPHENYHVSRLFALRGGISMPSAAPAEEGTALLADDLKSLELPPIGVGAEYAKVLVGGTDVKAATHFDLDGDTIIEKSGAAWVAAARKAARADGYDVKYSVSAAQSETPIVSLSTGVGGGLVGTTVRESRTEAQDGDYQPKAVGAVTALSGLKGAQKRIVSEVAHQLLFFVPSKTSGEKIQLLGYTTELVGAKK